MRVARRTPRSPRIDWPTVLCDACRRIEQDAPSLGALAAALGVSRAELQRQFRQRLGASPKAYAQALALARLARGADRGANALAAVLEAGFGANSTAYAATSTAFGTTPGRLRGALDIGWWLGLSDLGWMLLGATGRGVCWLAFGAAPGPLLEELRAAFPRARLYNDEARLYAWFDTVRQFVLLPRQALDLPLDIQGTAFQSRVWRALRAMPLGATVSYGALARQLGAPNSVRAVAGACARNRVALLIPCHRVGGADGAPTGYRWGLERKRRLLRREAEAAGAARAQGQRATNARSIT